MGILATQEVTKRFGGLVALQDVSIDVREWEIVGLIGPNGAGKTTLFNCITGLYAPDAGRILHRDEEIDGLPVHARTARGIARTFQNVGLVKSLTVLDNLVIAQHRHAGYSILKGFVPAPEVLREEDQLRTNAEEILRFLDLLEFKDTHCSGLPYGILKRVELGQALSTDPDILMLDEPTSGLGPEEMTALGELLRRLRDDLGLTIFLIEHHVPLVVDICDQVYCLNFGQVLAAGGPEEVRKDPDVVTAYLGESRAEEVA